MKIRTYPENKVYAGTAEQIVQKMAKDAIFFKVKTSEDYMRKVAEHLPSIKLKGRTNEERCKSFLKNLLRIGIIEIIAGKL